MASGEHGARSPQAGTGLWGSRPRDGGQCGSIGIDLPCTVAADFEAELVD